MTYNKSGQSVVEILIALAIFAMVISAIIAVSFGGQSLSLDAETANEALYIAEENLETAKANAKKDWNSIVNSSSTVEIYTHELIVQDISNFEKLVTSRVTWSTDPVRTQAIELQALLTALEVIADLGGDDGGDGLSGDWRNPQTLGSISLNPSGNQGTGLDVLDKIVYMTSSHASQASADFWIINATNGQNPSITSSLNTGKGLNSVDAADNYAYAANQSNSKQLQIIDISNALLPILVKEFSLPGVSDAEGLNLFYLADKVYIGTKVSSGAEFHIIDVSSPATPSSLGSFEVGGDVAAVYVSGNTAYITTSIDSSEVKILDVTAPANIVELGSFNSAGGADGLSLYLNGLALYFGKKSSSPEFQALDVLNPLAVEILEESNVDGDVLALHQRDYLLFMCTGDSNDEFQVWNITDSENHAFWSSLNFPQLCADLDFEDNIVYAAVRSNDALRIITSQ